MSFCSRFLRNLVFVVALVIVAPAVVAAQARVVTATGPITTTNSNCVPDACITLLALGTANGTIQVSGTWVGTLQFEGSVDGTTWFAVPVVPIPVAASVTSTATTGQWIASTALGQFRVRASAWTSGTANVSILFTPSGGGSSNSSSITGEVALETPNGDSAMDETFNAAKVVIENVITNGGQSAAAGVTAYPNCTGQTFLKMTTATTTQIVALTSGETIRVCHIVLLANGTTTATFVSGTGSNCATSQDALTPAYDLTAQTGFVAGDGTGTVLDARTASEALCVTNSQAVNLSIFIRYASY